ncbi:thioredoxin family protein [Tumebacillus permanentifrigoris]|uniref:Thioredoxin n=1 Tax=Tumebacillus permanentifrigoris TaxID=378543 RepID=A0A316DH19_9BACL|nr:thioredoxin family protein [Tumebacillus permanentifrigoris]PWK15873.1 thioredoxin 1 [Tumebacillus permanentifrigoris]
MKQATEQNFATLIEHGVVLADFHASWCPPCSNQLEVLTQIEQETADFLTLIRVDIDHCGQLVHKYGLLSVPTLLLFQEGRVVERIVGVQSKKVLLELITPYLL